MFLSKLAERVSGMKKKKIVIIAAIVLAASVGICGALVACNGSGSETSSTESKVDESTEGSVESEKVSEETSSPESSHSESSAESSKDSDKSKQESSKTESSKQESSKKEASKQESSKVESSKESSKPSSPAQVPITSLSLPKSSLQLRVGESVSLEPGVMPSNATERSLVAHYSNSNIAYYDGHTVTANGVGSSTVGISTEDGRYRVDIEVVVSANSVNSGNSSNSGNSGSTSKPSSTQDNGGSSSKPSGNTSKPSNTQQSSDTQSSSGSSSTAKKWIASEHTKDAVKTRDGHTVYECPEIVPYLNYYRRQAGVPDVTFFGTEEWKSQTRAYYEDLLKSPNYREAIKEDFPNCVNPDGTVNVDKIIEQTLEEGDGQSVRDNLEYSINHHVLDHNSDYGEGVAMCNAGEYFYDPQQWILDFKSSPAHWELLMRPSLTVIYAAYSHENENDFTFMIG